MGILQNMDWMSNLAELCNPCAKNNNTPTKVKHVLSGHRNSKQSPFAETDRLLLSLPRANRHKSETVSQDILMRVSKLDNLNELELQALERELEKCLSYKQAE